MRVSLQTTPTYQQNLPVVNKLLNKTQNNEMQTKTDFMSALDYSSMINKVGISNKGSVSFSGKCLIDKNAWETLSYKEKEKIWDKHSELFGLDTSRSAPIIFHPNWDRLQKRIKFTNENFPGSYYYTSGISEPWSNYCRGDWYSVLGKLSFCFLNKNLEEEDKRLELAEFLRKNSEEFFPKAHELKNIATETASCISRSIIDGELDENYVGLAKVDSQKYLALVNLDSGVLSRMEKAGTKRKDIALAILQHVNKEELTEQQLDMFADLKLAIDAHSETKKVKEEFSKVFEDLNVGERIKAETFVSNPDGTTAELLKSKHFTYYKVTNGTDNMFITNRDGYGKRMHCYGYDIQFPEGVWKSNKVVEHPRYTRSYHNFPSEPLIKCQSSGEWISVSLPPSDSIYFEKIVEEKK